MNEVVHDFATSANYDDAVWWRDFYRATLTHYRGHEHVTDRTLQRQGIDHRVKAGDAELLIDCKVRSRRYPDVLLEIKHEHDDGRRTRGWARKPLRCHYLAYIYKSEACGLLISFHLMQRALSAHYAEWKAKATAEVDGFRWVPARNKTYTTVSIAVPTDVLLAAMNEAVGFAMDEAA